MRSRGISRKSDMWHFQFSIWLKCSFGEVFCWKPHLNWSNGSKVMSNWMILKTIEIHSFFWLYHTINAADFRLIPLDHNTYVQNKPRILLCVICKMLGLVMWLLTTILSLRQNEPYFGDTNVKQEILKSIATLQPSQFKNQWFFLAIWWITFWEYFYSTFSLGTVT